MKDWVNGGLAVLMGESYVALSNFGGSIAANPIYQQFHMLIWFAGGIVFTYAMIRLHIRQRIADKIRGTPIMPKPTTTVVEVRAATPSYATSRPAPALTVTPTEAVPVEVKKETETA